MSAAARATHAAIRDADPAEKPYSDDLIRPLTLAMRTTTCEIRSAPGVRAGAVNPRTAQTMILGASWGAGGWARITNGLGQCVFELKGQEIVYPDDTAAFWRRLAASGI